jgi:fumarate hydratase class II
MISDKFRIEKDSMGEVKVPIDSLYAAQTQRAIDNFPVSGLRLPRNFIKALGLIKSALAKANEEVGLLESTLSAAIVRAADDVAEGKHDDQFPIDIFQTGSGTSTNMNCNEVIASLATKYLGKKVHPNDHVNMGQSSNDVIPTAIHVSGTLLVNKSLIPSLDHLANTIDKKSKQFETIVKTGRTHLMDAMPLTLGQEFSGWESQVRQGIARVEDANKRLMMLPQGGTAVGTGINAHPKLAELFTKHLSASSELLFVPKDNYFEGISTQDAAVEMSGQLKTISVSLMKIANDLRWMNSGPFAGLREIMLPAMQPGSSIMPGKINPVIPESVCMVCAQVIGNDMTITIAGQSGNFQLNVMLPVIAYNLNQSIEILSNVSRLLADKAILGLNVNIQKLNIVVEKNPMLVTALNSVIGYENGVKIANEAYARNLPIKEVAKEMTDLSKEELEKLLDPATLAKGGIVK